MMAWYAGLDDVCDCGHTGRFHSQKGPHVCLVGSLPQSRVCACMTFRTPEEAEAIRAQAAQLQNAEDN